MRIYKLKYMALDYNVLRGEANTNREEKVNFNSSAEMNI